MSDKVKMQVRAAELVALTKHLAKALVKIPKEDLKKNEVDYLICSAAHELYSKVKPKAEEIRIFPKRSDSYTISITRTQALALVMIGHDESQPVDSYEATFINRLLGEIYQMYLI